jgi:cysteine desulfuration protein SufE
MDIWQRENEVIEELELFDDWMDKYNHIIDIGKNSPGIAEEFKTKENMVFGCASQVWVYHEIKDGKMYFFGDSDALIPKGIVSIILRIYSGSSPEDIVEHKPVFVEQTGLLNNLTPNRSNGLASMIQRIKTLAKSKL